MRHITPLVKSVLIVTTLFAISGCEHRGSSSNSVKQSRSRHLFVAEYSIPFDATLGPYRPVEVWIESGSQSSHKLLVVRLKGPHVDQEPRVQVADLTESDYRAIWSEPNGPPYEVWAAPDPVPDKLTLEREGMKITLLRQLE